jgi:ribonuclease HI
MLKSTHSQVLKGTLIRIKKIPNLIMESLCWFDGATHNNGLLSGAGSLLKTMGRTTYRWTLNCRQGTNTRVELLGLWASLTLAHRLNLAHLHVLGDSKIVIDWINQNCNLKVTNLMGWMTKIRELTTLFINIKFDHIYREENMEADALSKLALQVRKERYFSTNGRMAMRAPHFLHVSLHDRLSWWSGSILYISNLLLSMGELFDSISFPDLCTFWIVFSEESCSLSMLSFLLIWDGQ